MVQRHSRWRAGVRQPPRPAQAVVPIAMRIAFVTQIVPYPPHGGVLQRGYNLLRELGREHRVHLLAFHHPDELPPGEPVERSRARARQVLRAGRILSALAQAVAGCTRRAAIASRRGSTPRPVQRARAAQRRRCARRLGEIVRLRRRRPTSCTSTPSRSRPTVDACGTVPACWRTTTSSRSSWRAGAEHEAGALARRYVAAQARRLRRLRARSSRRASAQHHRVRSRRGALRDDRARRAHARWCRTASTRSTSQPRRRRGHAGADLHRRHEHVRQPRRGRVVPRCDLAAHQGRGPRRRDSSPSGSVRAPRVLEAAAARSSSRGARLRRRRPSLGREVGRLRRAAAGRRRHPPEDGRRDGAGQGDRRDHARRRRHRRR